MARKIHTTFKRSTNDNIFSKCWKIVEVPLNFLRDYTVPMAELAEWDRTKASILPFIIPWAFCFLQGWLTIGGDSVDTHVEERAAEKSDQSLYVKVCLYSMIPATFCSIYIAFCTKVSRPPETIMFVFAILAFVMSIQWVSFVSNIVVDLLAMVGIMLNLPKPLLGLTLLAWGNCMGDLNADVAMTKKGFGEMAITGCMAGPIFNILCGLGLSCVSMLLNDLDG